MHKIMIGALVAMALSLTSLSAGAQQSVDWSQLPNDKAAMQALNSQHLKILRRAVRACSMFSPGTLAVRFHHGNPCVISDVERAVRQSDDASLLAFHQALPLTDRYDERRSWVAVRRLMDRRPAE